MTTKPVPAPSPSPSLPETRFPDTPKEDMQNLRHLNSPGYIPVLDVHLAAPETTAVLSEYPIGRNVRQRRGLLSPDLLIAFDVELSTIIDDNGYAIDYHGKAPDFVLEIASRGTARRDEIDKRQGYEDYGVPEYWRFDNTGGQFYSVNLAGDRLVNGRYEPIPVQEVGHARYWGYSAVLGLYVCWEYGHLRWYDPATGRYLPTGRQTAEGLIIAETGWAEAENRLAVSEAARAVSEAARATAEAGWDNAETQLAAERAAHSDTATQLAAERAARRALEAQIQRLQNP